jgi:hypothetical protein
MITEFFFSYLIRCLAEQPFSVRFCRNPGNTPLITGIRVGILQQIEKNFPLQIQGGQKGQSAGAPAPARTLSAASQNWGESPKPSVYRKAIGLPLLPPGLSNIQGKSGTEWNPSLPIYAPAAAPEGTRKALASRIYSARDAEQKKINFFVRLASIFPCIV